MAGKRSSVRGSGGGTKRCEEILRRVQDQDRIAKKAAFYRKILDEDCTNLYFTEEEAQVYPGGPAAARAMSDTMRKFDEEFKEHAARCLKEYEAMGYTPTSARSSAPITSKL